jgi:hypothetical protein
MGKHPIIMRVLCVALIAALMMPLGRMLFPYIQGSIGGLPFETMEAVVSATLGFSLYAVMFG